MSKKHKNVCRVLDDIDHLLTVIFTITGYVSISAFNYLVAIPIEIVTSAIGLKIRAKTAEIKEYKPIIKKKKKHDKIVLLAKCKLNSMEVLIYKNLIDWSISHDIFFWFIMCWKNFMKGKRKSKIPITTI